MIAYRVLLVVPDPISILGNSVISGQRLVNPVRTNLMAKRHDKTTMGGAKHTFQTTLWSEIQNVKTLDEDKRQIIIGNFLKKYWKPVYCYIRRKGYDNEPAKDLTQGFFHEIVLGHNLIQQADQTKGRFRTFLLTTLDRYVTNVYRRETAQKRKSTHPHQRLCHM